MSTINEIYINALLADAAYVNLHDGNSNETPLLTGTRLTSAIAARLTQPQSDFITSNFEVLNQELSPTGAFDAVVWRGKAGTEYAGKIYVSMRGTQGGTDIADDVELAGAGIPARQIVDMVNWWLRITTPSPEEALQIKALYRIVPGYPAPTVVVDGYSEAPRVEGVGVPPLVGLSSIEAVNGHSLGGYLAAAFTRLFGGQLGCNVRSVVTFNSAGFNNLKASSIASSYNQIAQLIGPSLGLGGFAALDRMQTNAFGENGIEVTTNSWADGNFTAPGFNQYGPRLALYQEDLLNGDPIANHYMYKQTDLLALGASLEKLQSNLTIAKLNDLVKVGSNDMKASYEGVLDGLRRILIDKNASAIAPGDVSGSEPTRVAYHETLKQFNDLFAEPSGALKAIAGKLTLNLADASLATRAKTDFAAFISLNALSPVVISTTDESAIAALKAANSDLAVAWNADRNARLYGDTTKVYDYSDSWYADRAAMLTYVVLANRDDIAGPMSVAGAQGAHYEDIASGKVIDIGLANDVIVKRQVLFGSDGHDVDDKLTGKSKDDRIYGGAGDDILDGQGGNDYLEGGSGKDTYGFSDAFGKDTVLDSDGLGQIKIKDQDLGEIKGDGSGGWKSTLTDNTVVALKLLDDARSSSGKKLVIQIDGDSANTITINNFDESKARSEEGYLGIKLGDKKLAVTEAGVEPEADQTNANYWSGLSASLSDLDGKSSSLTEGAARSFLISLDQAAKTGDTLTLNLNGLQAQAILGDRRVDANGAVITLVAGQTTVSFALIAPDDISADIAGNLSVTYRSGEESVTSNSWSLNIKDAGEADRTFIGDQRAQLWGAELQPEPVVDEDGNVTQETIGPDDPRYNTYAWGKTEWAADGTLTEGVVQEGFNDVITGTDENDRLEGLGGNDALDGGEGNDRIEGGDGDDVIGGGSGSDVISAGTGNDFILSASHLNVQQRTKVDDVWQLPPGASTHIEGSNWGVYRAVPSQFPQIDGASGILDGRSDVVDAGDGDDMVIAGHGDDRIHGGAGMDHLMGAGGHDVIEGGADRDVVYGDSWLGTGNFYTPAEQHGHDFLDGGEGDDVVIGQGGDDVVYGGTGADLLLGDYLMSGLPSEDDPWFLPGEFHGQDYLDGEDGDDALWGGGRDDVLYGGAGNDTMMGDHSQEQLAGTYHGDDFLDGEDGDDIMAGNGGHDVLYGGSGKDQIYGDGSTDLARGVAGEFHGDDYLDGEDNDDELFGGGGADILYGGSGNDTLGGDASDLAGEYHANDHLDGEDGDDVLTGGGGQDALYGGAGNDVLHGDDDPAQLDAAHHGDDRLDGGDGDDALTGGGGNDILLGGAGDDLLIGGDGADYLEGGEGDDRYEAGAGDTVFDQRGANSMTLTDGTPYAVSASGVDLILDYGEAGQLTVVGALTGDIQTINGEEIAAWLQSQLKTDVQLSSSHEWQVLIGGAGDDELVADHAGVQLSGGNGRDLLVGGDFSVILVGGGGNDVLQTGVGNSELDGGEGDDQLLAGAGDDELTGGLGKDELSGGDGNDLLSGGVGDDLLDGGAGNDLLAGGAGADILVGGTGADTYVFDLNSGDATLVDVSTEGSTIQLDHSLIELENVRASRRGDDLKVEILGYGGSFTIQDYYLTENANWTVRDASGSALSISEVIASSTTQWLNTAQYLLDEYVDWKIGAFNNAAASLREAGYIQMADGSWYQSPQQELDIENGYWTHFRETRTERYSATPPHSYLSDLSSSEILYQYWSNSQYSSVYLSDNTISVNHFDTVISDENIFLQDFNFSANEELVWGRLSWRPSGSVEDQSSWFSGGFYSWTPGLGANMPGATEFRRDYSRTVTSAQLYSGTITQLLSSPSGITGGPLPSDISVIFSHSREFYNAGKFILTDGDHVVQADGNAVIGGTGNNTIYAAGYAYGGTGDSQLLGGRYLVAGAGNQLLADGTVMVVGDGQTTVVGRAQLDYRGEVQYQRMPDSRILIDPNNVGVDLIVSDDLSRGRGWAWGGSSNDSIDDIYFSHGIEDIEESYLLGGLYELKNRWSNESYYSSLEEARAAYSAFDEVSRSFEDSVRYIQPLPFFLVTPTFHIPTRYNWIETDYYEKNQIQVIQLNGNSFSATERFVVDGSLSRRFLTFGPGVTIDDIALSWGEAISPIDGIARVTLDLAWGIDQGVRIMIPRTGDGISSTIHEIEFSDGSHYFLSQLIDLAPGAPNFDLDFVSLSSGDGHQILNADEVPGLWVAAAGVGDVTFSTAGPEGVDLRLSINNGQDSLTLKNWFAGSQYPEDVIMTLQDGSFITAQELGAMALSGIQNAGDDELEGTDGEDVLDGGFGDDWLEGYAGNDILMGGAGGDELTDSEGSNLFLAGYGDDYLYTDAGVAFMIGGRGADEYGGSASNTIVAYNAGDEFDVVSIREHATISLGGGLSLDDISVSGDGYHLYLHFGEGDVLQLEYYDYYGHSDIRLQIIGGEVRIYDLDAVLVAYKIEGPTEVQRPMVDLLDAHLLYVATDKAIGGRLAFEYATAGNLNALSVEVIQAILAEPGFGSEAQDISTEHAPELNHPVADLTTQQPQAFTYQFSEDTFTDANAGDVLSWSLTQADGQPLPDWLTFDVATRTLSGVPRNQDAGELMLQLMVTDLSGLTASQNFALTVHEAVGVSLVGTTGADVLAGGAGDDLIDGGVGADRMAGGDGEDRYIVDNMRDVVVEEVDRGIDRVEAYVSYRASANVEVIALMGEANISAYGNDLTNSLEGNTGNNRLDGGAGADQMLGGLGNDTYVVDDAGDVVVELTDEGTDAVQSFVNYTLGANVENLTLTGTAATSGTGNELNNVITGNAAGNTLRGLGGNDTLRGGLEADVLEGGEGNDRLDGGAGADQLAGGLGNDVYVVDDAGDMVTELAAEGTDTVQSMVDYTLGANQENLALTGTAASSGTGNELNNVITGNAAGNVLRGLGGNDTLRGGLEADILEGGEGNDRLDGGTGADQLAGGLGNDTYVVDDAGDMVTEQADEGTDTVQSLVDYTLGANLENLTLTGTAASNGTGNELNNVITGNMAGNTLRGMGGNDMLRGGLEADILEGGEGNDRLDGGAGADQLAGGLGNDVYVVDEIGDVVTELADEGTDTVQSLVDYTLGANLENLTLTGTAASNGTGNELNNVITGNTAGNTLRGMGGNDTLRGGLEADILEGGEGNDRLEGGLGADTYLFSRGEGRDTVVDTDAATDVNDVLQFGADISAEQIWLRKSGNHLEISLLGTTDKVTVANWYLGEDRRVEVLQLANGQQLLDTQVQNLVQAMAAFAPPAAGQTTLPENYASTLAPVIAANWQ